MRIEGYKLFPWNTTNYLSHLLIADGYATSRNPLIFFFNLKIIKILLLLSTLITQNIILMERNRRMSYDVKEEDCIQNLSL